MSFGHHPFEGNDGLPRPTVPPGEWKLSRGQGQRGRVRGAGLGLPASGPGSVAPVGTRFAGLLLDWLIVLPWFLVAYLLKHPHFVTLTRPDGSTYRHLAVDRPSTAVALLLLVPPALYTIGFIAHRGRTIGEQLMGLRVVRIADLAPVVAPDAERTADDSVAVPSAPGWGASSLRWFVIGWVTILGTFTAVLTTAAVFVPFVVLLWACWDANGQGLHDKAAKVVVLRTR